MKRYVAVTLSVLLLMTSVLSVNADWNYNDEELNWGSDTCAHLDVTVVAAVASTCTQAGHAAYTQCNDCGAVIYGSDAALPMPDHTYDSVVTAPDCEEDGYTTYTCSACGDSYVGDVTEALGHDYDLTEDVAASCTADGKKVYTCANCGDSYTEAIPSDGHKYNAVVTAPDCDNSGYTTYTCSACGDSYVDDEVAALGHAYYVEKVTPPNCEEDGYTTYACSACGHSYVGDETAALGHAEVIDEAVAPFSCIRDGLTEGKHCSVCNKVLVAQEAVKGEHMPFDREVSPDCVNPGVMAMTECAVCHEILFPGVDVPALGHNYISVVTPPNCEEDGYTTHTCSRCGDSYVDNVISGSGKHTFDEGVITLEPSCYSDGVKIYTCGDCGYVYDEVIPAFNEHIFGDWVCDNEFAHSRTCLCGGLDTQRHTYDDDFDAECNGCGYVRKVSIPGDVNGDGRVNNRDLGILQRYLNEWEIAIDETSADMNEDDNVNNRDLGLLQQLLNT